jgi:hypothetical protein
MFCRNHFITSVVDGAEKKRKATLGGGRKSESDISLNERLHHQCSASNDFITIASARHQTSAVRRIGHRSARTASSPVRKTVQGHVCTLCWGYRHRLLKRQPELRVNVLVRALINESSKHRLNHVWSCESQHVVIALRVLRVILELRPSNVRLAQSTSLTPSSSWPSMMSPSTNSSRSSKV